MNYDAAGNQTKDTYSAAAVTRVYDAENRMTSETQASSYVAATYSYDGDGRRVKRIVGSVETWQVYGLGGELVAEYAANADHSLPQKEYGYRNGQLLVTATIGTGSGSPPTYTAPDPLVPGVEIKLEHLTELRTAVNQLRVHAGLPAVTWTTDPAPVRYVTEAKAAHILELRTALEGARSHLGMSTGGYTHPGLTVGDPIYAIDFQELRNQIASAWVSVRFNWLLTDQLGTPRMIFDESGSLANMSRHDYLPFGEELFGGTPAQPGVGGRLTSQGYTADSVRQKFTQKERDNETGLDYFGARYYESTQGRFTSPDPLLSSGTIFDPQSWNRYSYTSNNPLRYIDPTGLYDWSADLGGSASDQDLLDKASAVQDAKKRKKAVDHANKVIGQRNQFRDALAGLDALAKSGNLTADQQPAIAGSVYAFGKENDGNKVIVDFKKQGSGTGATTDGTDAFGYIFVSFDPGHHGNDLIIDLAHEGSHVADWQAFNWGADDDFTNYQTERKAYMASSYAAQALGKGYYPNSIEEVDVKQAVWNSGWKAADIGTKRSAGIDRLLANRYFDDSGKPITPSNQGWRASQIKLPL
jgi:RHS repeat-associated protein